jgi:hypothetical protein
VQLGLSHGRSDSCGELLSRNSALPGRLELLCKQIDRDVVALCVSCLQLLDPTRNLPVLQELAGPLLDGVRLAVGGDIVCPSIGLTRVPRLDI